MTNLVIGTILYPKSTHHTGPVILSKIVPSHPAVIMLGCGVCSFVIRTDFGNHVTLTHQELTTRYHITSQVQCVAGRLCAQHRLIEYAMAELGI